MNRRELFGRTLAVAAVAALPISAAEAVAVPEPAQKKSRKRIAIGKFKSKPYYGQKQYPVVIFGYTEFIEQPIEELRVNDRFIVLRDSDPPDMRLPEWWFPVRETTVYICDADGVLSGYNENIGWGSKPMEKLT
jgi:hypothetical protein